ncbi:MAG: RDD family protein [Myxococcota bacterium]
MIESARRLRLQGARTWQRLIACGVDGLACVVLALLPYLLGLVSLDLFEPPADRFLPDHLLELVATNPAVLLLPPAWLMSIGCMWHFCWLYFNDGRTPGLRIAGLRVVDRYGDPLGWAWCTMRVVGHIVSALGLGLGWMWVWVDADRRSWPDLFSRSYVVRY